MTIRRLPLMISVISPTTRSSDAHLSRMPRWPFRSRRCGHRESRCRPDDSVQSMITRARRSRCQHRRPGSHGPRPGDRAAPCRRRTPPRHRPVPEPPHWFGTSTSGVGPYPVAGAGPPVSIAPRQRAISGPTVRGRCQTGYLAPPTEPNLTIWGMPARSTAVAGMSRR